MISTADMAFSFTLKFGLIIPTGWSNMSFHNPSQRKTFSDFSIIRLFALGYKGYPDFQSD
jgi:hypothetical protein